MVFIAASKYAKIEAKKLIIDKTTIAHKKNNCPNPNIKFEVNYYRNNHKHMANIPEHHTNKKAEGHNI